jgi:predicted NBD/HSP70 family sugar kinase
MRSSAGQAMSLLRDRGPLSRADLARSIGITAPALTNLANTLISQGNAAETSAPAATGVGRPASLLSLVPDNAFVVGLHFGVGRLGLVLTDALLDIRARENHLIDLEATTIEDVVALAASATRNLIERAGVLRGKIRGVGVGVPGRVDAAGRVNLGSVLSPGEKGFPFADRLEEQLGLPVLLSHNVTAMALAETLYGAGKNASTVLNLYMRRGIGAGLVRHGAAGDIRSSAVELGHIRVEPRGAACHCGGSGCLETVFSERAILQRLGLKAMPAEGLFQAAMADTTLWDEVYPHFMQVLATSVTLLEPDLVLLSGHLGEAPAALLDSLRRDIPEAVMPQFRGVKIERAVLQPDAGALGAACIGLERFFYEGQQL